MVKKTDSKIDKAIKELKAYNYDLQYFRILIDDGKKEKADVIKRRLFDIEQKIEELPQPYRCILYMRYVRRRSIAEIAIKLNYCERQTIRKHKKAIELYSILN